MSIPKRLPSAVATPLSDLLPFARVRLVVADLDGTLIGKDERVWSEVASIVRSVSRYNVRFTVATGRTLQGLRSLLGGLSNPGATPLILYNGGVIADARAHGPILRVPISPYGVGEILALCRPKPVNVFGYYWSTADDHQLGRSVDAADGERVVGWSCRETKPLLDFNGQRVEWRIDWSVPSDAPYAILIENADPGLHQVAGLYEALQAISHVGVTRSGQRYLEVRAENADKWTAVSWLAKRLGIATNEILALGDNDNDLEMLVHAGIGVCVGNSSANVISSADYITNGDAASGVIEALRLIREAHRLLPAIRLAHFDGGGG